MSDLARLPSYPSPTTLIARSGSHHHVIRQTIGMIVNICRRCNDVL